MGNIGTAKAAEELGVTQRRVIQLIASGELRGQQIGRTWVVNSADVAKLAKKERKPGPRPRKGK